jgi:hypothetical protein
VPASRTTRDTFLAVGSAVGVGAGILTLISGALYLADQLATNYVTSLDVAEGLYVLSAVFAIGGFGAAFGGFRLESPSSRRGRLGLAGISFAASGAAGAAAHVVRAFEYGTHNLSGAFTASAAVEAASSLAFVAAGATVAVAFLSSRAGRRFDTALGWAGVALAVFFSLFAVSAFLAVIGYSDLHAPGGITGGVGVEAAGAVVAATGAVIAGLSFLTSADGREGLLAAAAVALAVGFLIVAIGGMTYAAADSDPWVSGKAVAADWLEAISWLGLMATAMCAAAGFRAGAARQS